MTSGDNELIMRMAASIQKRSIARSGSALSGEICLDYATAALATIREETAAAKDVSFYVINWDGIGGTDMPKVCGELSDGA